MKLTELHQETKTVSAVPLFKGEEGKTLALRIQKGERLKEHLTKVPALLLCISGSATFEYVNGERQELVPGSYVNIVSNIVHRVEAHSDAEFVLMK